MKLNDISIFKYYNWPSLPHPLFRYTINPSNKTVSFLTKLLKDQYFQNKITTLRSKYKIPPNGYKASLLKKYKHPFIIKLGRFKRGAYDIQPMWDRMKKTAGILPSIISSKVFTCGFSFY